MTQDQDALQATYRRTVLATLQGAENARSGFGNTRAQLGQLSRIEATTARSARSARLNAQRIAAGTSSIIHQREIERQRLTATIAVAQARAQRPLSYIAVNKALGLGWSEPADSRS